MKGTQIISKKWTNSGYFLFKKYDVGTPASAKLSNPKPNARWRDGFSLVPSIRVGFADKRKVGALVQSGRTSCWSSILYWALISLIVWTFKVNRKKLRMQAG
jgi:hypothetical protein